MNNKFFKILQITAYTGIVIMTVMAIIKACVQKRKQETKEKMILIAKQINNDIRNTERRISPKYHHKNQEKYEELWGEDYCK